MDRERVACLFADFVNQVQDDGMTGGHVDYDCLCADVNGDCLDIYDDDDGW